MNLSTTQKNQMRTSRNSQAISLFAHFNASRQSTKLLPPYQSINRSSQNPSLRFDLIEQLFSSTDSSSFNDFASIFTFGLEIDIFRKGKKKSVTLFLDPNIPTLLWFSSPTKAFLIDLIHTDLYRFDPQFQSQSQQQHYLILRYFDQQIPLLFTSQGETKHYFALFQNFKNYHKMKLETQYPPYFSKMLKFYTLQDTTSDQKIEQLPQMSSRQLNQPSLKNNELLGSGGLLKKKKASQVLKISQYILKQNTDFDNQLYESEVLNQERLLIELHQNKGKSPISASLPELSYQHPQNFMVNSYRKITSDGVEVEDSQVLQFMKIVSCNSNLKAVYQYYSQISMQNRRQWTYPFMEKHQFLTFLQSQQQQPPVSIDKLMKNFPSAFSFYDFCQFLYNPKCNSAASIPELNRSLPLTNYFIWSSHNTYLSGNQLTSDSKVERYAWDLGEGVKCVQIDVHDSGATPIVTHAVKGLYLNKAVTFESVIKEISHYCQQNENFDPIILSIQNHTCLENRHRMVEIIFRYLDKFLFLLNEAKPLKVQASISINYPNSGNKLESRQMKQNIQKPILQPQKVQAASFQTLAALKNKIIIKTDSKLSSILSQTKKTADQNQNISPNFAPSTQPLSYRSFPNFSSHYSEYIGSINRNYSRKNTFVKDFSKNFAQIQTDEEPMAKVTALFKNPEGIDSLNSQPYHCVSLTNKKLSAVDEGYCQNYTSKSFLRVYPVATEVASSNFDPIPSLLRGAQLIALNTQTKDDFAWMLRSYFTAGTFGSQPSRTGYIQKPSHLTENRILAEIGKSFNHFKKKIEVSVLSHTHEIKINLYGTTYDMRNNPSPSFCFTIRDFHQAFLMLTIGSSLKQCLPVRFLKEGYRVVMGRNSNYSDSGVRIILKVKIKTQESLANTVSS